MEEIVFCQEAANTNCRHDLQMPTASHTHIRFQRSLRSYRMPRITVTRMMSSGRKYIYIFAGKRTVNCFMKYSLALKK